MLRNFTALDVTGSVEAALLLSLFLFIPGYVIGWVSNVSISGRGGLPRRYY